MLKTRSLSITFGRKLILDNIDLILPAGTYALQGPNGIGKSTLLSVLSGAVPPDAGEVWFDDISMTESPREARAVMSYAPDESPAYPFLTGRDFLHFVARIKRVEINDDILSLIQSFSLEQHLDTRFDVMSLGTQKKFLLIAAFCGNPAIYLADEPSNGLDKQTRALLAERFCSMRSSHVVFFTSHDAHFIDSSEAQILQFEDLSSAVRQDNKV